MTVSVSALITYAAERGTTVVDGPATSQAITRATDHITFSYVSRFASGYTIDSPNVDAATYEAAMIEIATPNFFTKTYTPSEQKVLTEAKGLKWTMTGGKSGAQASTPTSTKIEAMLRPYMSYGIGLMVV